MTTVGLFLGFLISVWWYWVSWCPMTGKERVLAVLRRMGACPGG